MLLASRRTCLLRRDCSCGHSRQPRVMLESVVKISLPAGEMEDYLMPSSIDTGKYSVLLKNNNYSFLMYTERGLCGLCL